MLDTSKAVMKILCHPNRCESCSKISNLECFFQQEGIEFSQKMVVFEISRGIIHFPKKMGLEQSQVPWKSSSWKSIYVGKNAAKKLADEEIIDIYHIEPYVMIYSKTSECPVFRVFPFFSTSLEKSLLCDLATEVSKKMVKAKTRLNTDEKIHRTKDEALGVIKRYIPEMEEETQNRLSLLLAYNSSILRRIIPIILDESVEEIFLDSPESTIYFDHGKWGRCESEIVVSEQDAKRFVTYIRATSNYHLDRTNPSLKSEICILGTNLRFSVALPPLSSQGLNLEIRRARKKPFSIGELIINNTIPLEAAAVLLLAINYRYNITIVGPPGSGKTTLLNALDMTTPMIWRKIYIEDAIESRLFEKHHQIRIRVDPFDEKSGIFDKETEIIKSLHRSPDYLILGEIQTRNHTNALFQALAAGLRSIQTAHSESASDLITRWKSNHGINSSNLAMMDLIVTMERESPGKSCRFISEIVEIERVSNSEGIIEFKGLNTIYEKDKGFLGWSKEGAFLDRFKKTNISLDETYQTIFAKIDNLRKNQSGLDKFSKRILEI